MKILVTGANGQLGYEICKRCKELQCSYRGVDVIDFDITDKEETNRYLQDYKPDCVVHCAAYTAVDKAETDTETCEAVNVLGTQNIANACRACGASMAYISTDYVFAGEGDTPYETDDQTNPQNVYGRTKLAGEQAVAEATKMHFIIRTSWVFGVNGKNFISTMLRLGSERSELNVVCDQVGSPTYARDLAVFICDLVRTKQYGIYHATNEGFCSWSTLAEAVMREAGLPCTIHPIPSAEYPTAAHRPMNSRLSKKKNVEAGFSLLPDWTDALRRYLAEMRNCSE